MAKGSVSFNFGANAPKPKKPKKPGGKKGSQSNAWRTYTSGGKKR